MTPLDGAFALLAAATGLHGVGGLRAGRRQLEAVRESVARPVAPFTPPCTLILPVKGLEEGLLDNLRSVCAQDYPDLEILVVARDADDPAVDAIRPLLGARAKLVIAGPGPAHTGEKIGNLLAAIAAARPESEVLAFADSDGRLGPGWLRALVAPLADPKVGAATGFRWYFPERAGAWSIVRSVWNSTVAGNFGGARAPFAWGGATALRRTTFAQAQVGERWIGSVSDDLSLTGAVRATGAEIAFSPGAMVASVGECGAREFFGWAVRQLMITRVYAPSVWLRGLRVHGHALYCAAMLFGALAACRGAGWALPLLLAALAPSIGRGLLRARAARLLFPDHQAWLARHGWSYSLLIPLVQWVWLAVWARSAFGRRIRWRDRTYDLYGPTRTEVS